MVATITFRGLEFDVDYYFQPEEKATYDYAGCPPCVEEINKITHNGTDFTEFLEEHECEISEIIYEQEHI